MSSRVTLCYVREGPVWGSVGSAMAWRLPDSFKGVSVTHGERCGLWSIPFGGRDLLSQFALAVYDRGCNIRSVWAGSSRLLAFRVRDSARWARARKRPRMVARSQT